ncbi:MAG: hypothetical protein LBT54_05445, partial [Bifidobacteriaceae bacterium]|jgi:UDP-N-acetylmuramoyl-L-alanyl-D-glutamate--2,6-diaminopimelate ligase|nr:hypothetical protein [Bifidobacteriaceae bacterium]
MEAVPRPAGAPLGIVDFAHTPDAIQASLRALGKSGAGRIIAVLGAGGERDQGKRPLMGAAAAARADLVIVTDDNPRREDPGEIRAAILAGTGTGRAQVREVPGRAAAIRAAVGAATGADTIAVLGKGHERSLTGPDGAQPWDDREALAQAIEEGGPWR